jgi:uncharacterized membrane protein YjjB (DUF3815 family)
MLVQIMTSFAASIGYGALFNTPKRLLIACGFCGMVGWMVYILLIARHIDSVPASLVAAFTVSILSQVFARVYKAPIISFNASGIIPLVPGGLAYDAMLSFVHNNYDAAIQAAAKVFLISGAIAVGLLFSEVAYRVTRKL